MRVHRLCALPVWTNGWVEQSLWLYYYLYGWLCNAQQFYFKDERGASGDARLRPFAISHFGGDIHFPFVAHRHLLQGNHPSFDEFAKAYGKGCPATAGVELLSIDGATCVVRHHHAPWLRVLSVRISFGQYLVIYPLLERSYTLFLGFGSEPIFVGLQIFFFVHNACIWREITQ